MAYPAKYYRMQHEVMLRIRYSTMTGLCPVCKRRPSARWPDGAKRITCGDTTCYLEWLPVRGEPDQ